MTRESPTSSELAFDDDQVTSDLICVTTYTNPECLAHTPKRAEGAGIYTFDLDLKTGALTKRGALAVSPNPAFLVRHPELPLLYGTTECIDRPGEVLTLSLDPANPSSPLKLLGRVPAGGRSTCYLNVAPDARSIAAVNYWDARLTVLPVDAHGAVGEVAWSEAMPGAEYVDAHNPDRTEHWTYRQRWPHTHCAVTEPHTGAQGVFVCDLGRDCIAHYARGEGGALEWRGEVALEAGLGPRHCVFHPRLRACYVVNELTSSVTVLRFNGLGAGGKERASEPGGVFEHLQTISTLPTEWQDKQTQKNGVWKAASHCSEIRLHPSGGLLFVGNRGHDSLAVFRVLEGEGGLLELSQIAPTGGACPRNYNFSSDGRWVITGNQDSDTLAIFACDAAKGQLELRHEVACPAPNFVYTVPPSRATFAPNHAA